VVLVLVLLLLLLLRVLAGDKHDMKQNSTAAVYQSRDN
jgi:hypothetical protein